MRGIVRHIALLMLAVFALTLSGCDKSKEPRQKPEKLEIVSIDKISGSMGGEWNVTATVKNNTIYNIRITSAQAFLKHDGRKIANVTTKEEISLHRRSQTQITIPLKITVASSMAALSALTKIGKGDVSKFTIDYDLGIAVLASKFNISDKDVSLEELTKEFNLGIKK